MSVVTPNASLPGHQEGEEQQNKEYELQLRSTMRRCVDSIQEFVNDNTGLLFIVASMVFISMMDVAVIKLHKTDPPVTTFQLILVRMAITFICCMIYMYLAKIPDPLLGPKGVRLWLLMRGIGGFIALFGIYFSLQYLSLSDATVLTFLSPTTTTVAGAIFLKEKFILRQAVAGLVSLVGVVLIARPKFIFGDSAHSHEPNGTTPSERLLAVGVSLVGVLGVTLAYISIRSIGNRAHTMHIMVYFAMQCVVGSTIGMIVTKTPVVIPTQIEWLSLLFMIGAFGFAAQIFLTLGFQREAVGRGTLALYTQIIFASFLEYIVFHTTPSRLSIFGILLIMGSAIYIALTKKPNSPEPNSISRPDDEELGRSLLSPNSDTP